MLTFGWGDIVNETISRYLANANQYWKQTSRTNKIMFVSIIGFALISIVILAMYFSRTEYALAYTDLSPEDAAAVKSYLEQQGIPYEFGPDGTSIGVPAKLVTDVKIDIAAQNLVQNGSQGFGLFRNNLSSFGMTDNEFDLLSVDARAGEIQKLITSYSGVSKAQVLLTIPKDSVFIGSGEPEQSSASVVVTFKPGYRPSQEVIDGIYNLVKTGVPNLTIENIKVADQSGVMLTPSELEGGGFGATSSVIEQQLKIKKMFEADIQRTIQSFLSQIHKPEKVAVSVIATLNFDQVNSQVKTFTPVNQESQSGIVRSEERIDKSLESEGGASVGGVVGTGETDIPNYPADSGGNGRTSSEESSRITNYEINEMTQSITSSPYAVKDLTIFVGLEPPVPNDPSTLSQETVDDVRRILSNVVGTSLANSGQTLTDEQLANKVVVMTQSFHGVEQADTASSTNWWLYGLGGAALALAAAGGVYVVRRRKRLAELALAEEEAAAAMSSVQMPTLDIEQMGNESQVRKQLENLAKRKPDEFVNLLRTWLADE